MTPATLIGDRGAFAAQLALGVLAALVFARAGALKLRDRRAFEGVIDNYDLLPQGLVAPVATVLPIAEGLIAAALPLPAPWRPWAEIAAAALVTAFALAMGINLARGRAHIDCGCGDASTRQPLHGGLVARNLALAGLLIAGAFGPVGVASPAAAVLGLTAGAAAFLLYLCQDAFAALPRRAARSSPIPPPDPRLGFAIHHRSGAAR